MFIALWRMTAGVAAGMAAWVIATNLEAPATVAVLAPMFTATMIASLWE